MNTLRYLISAALVFLAASVFNPSTAVVGTIWCVSFWLLAGLDFYKQEVQGVVVSTRWSYIDRFLGYLVSAPLVFPVRFFELIAK